MKKVLLYGIGGTYNYGCEAIVRGTVALLKNAVPDIEIYCASFRPDDDRRRLSDCPVTILQRRLKSRYSPQRIVRSIMQKAGFSFYPCIDDPKQASGMDAVFSIGGDLYTLNRNGKLDSLLFRFGEEVQSRDIPYIIWGASIGPFSVNPPVEQRLARHFRLATRIYAREAITIGYLSEIGVTQNIESIPDPAFFVATDVFKEKIGRSPNPRIAINLSPLSSLHVHRSLAQAAEKHAEIIDDLIARYNAEVILIPHVIDEENEDDDDLRYLKRVMGYITRQERVSLLDTDPGFIGTRHTLKNCDILIAARMHCAINGICSHIPTILLSYSAKARGMCEFIYGDHSYVININDFGTPAFNQKLDDLLTNYEMIQTFLANRISEIRKYVFHWK